MLTLLENGKGLKDLFLCECGNKKWINKQNVKRGLQISCGCYSRIAIRNAQIKKALSRDVKIYDNYIELQLSGGEYIKLDIEDYNNIKNYSWYKSKRNSVESRIEGKLIKIHRLVMNASIGQIVDHINGDTLDNRKINLRICTVAQNTYNSKKPKNGLTSKYKGVYFDTKRRKYIVRVSGKYFGGYEDEKTAGLIYNEKAKILFGQYAKFNNI